MKRRLLILSLLISLFSEMGAQQYNEPFWTTENRKRKGKLNTAPGYAHSFGIGTTFTDYCITGRYSYMFFQYDGWLGKRLNGNGFYITYGNGRYPSWNCAGAEHHDKVSAGFMLGSPWVVADWWPTINFGIARHWLTTYPGYEKTNDPVFQEWDLEFGSAGQIGHYYPWVTVALLRQLEMTFGVGITF